MPALITLLLSDDARWISDEYCVILNLLTVRKVNQNETSRYVVFIEAICQC